MDTLTNGNPVVVDITSDEDSPATEVCDTDIDWKELLVGLYSDAGVIRNSDKVLDSDSDDVVVVREVLAKPKPANKSSPLVAQVDDDDDDDDDCVVLDGDPDKPTVKFPDPDLAAGSDSDDLFIVAEKGQVACRDYPHPRHHCVKFPFDSTLHSDHCNLCHCYVCDSPAPCGNWGNGSMMINHCHANEKEEFWTSERKRAKQEKSGYVLTSPDTSFWKDILLRNPAPAPPSALNFGTHGHLLVQAQSFSLPNTITSQSSAGVSGRHGSYDSLLAQQQINPYSYNSQRASGTSLGYVTSPSMFKGPGVVPARQGNNSLNNYIDSFANHSGPIQFASKQANLAVNLSTYQNSLAASASQMSQATVTSQGQAHQYNPLTAYAHTSPYMGANANQNGTISAPISSTTHCDTSQSSQGFAGTSNGQAGQSSFGINPDFRKSELGMQFVNIIAALDSEAGPPSFDVDHLWSLV